MRKIIAIYESFNIKYFSGYLWLLCTLSVVIINIYQFSYNEKSKIDVIANTTLIFTALIVGYSYIQSGKSSTLSCIGLCSLLLISIIRLLFIRFTFSDIISALMLLPFIWNLFLIIYCKLTDIAN